MCVLQKYLKMHLQLGHLMCPPPPKTALNRRESRRACTPENKRRQSTARLKPWSWVNRRGAPAASHIGDGGVAGVIWSWSDGWRGYWRECQCLGIMSNEQCHWPRPIRCAICLGCCGTDPVWRMAAVCCCSQKWMTRNCDVHVQWTARWGWD